MQPLASSLAMASCTATKAPVMLAVRVPPSAWITSQSICRVRSPSSCRSIDRAQRAADQALDFLGAAGLLAARGFAVAARIRGARQHAVFGGQPALARRLSETTALFRRRWRCRCTLVSPNSISTEPSACLRVVARDAHVAQLVGLAAAGALSLIGHVGIGVEESGRETAILPPNSVYRAARVGRRRRARAPSVHTGRLLRQKWDNADSPPRASYTPGDSTLRPSPYAWPHSREIP